MMKPLEGLKVIELATFIAGPTCARAFADWGADVVKVENPKGDPMRGAGSNTKMPVLPEENPGFDLCNIGKKSLVLNLRTGSGMDVLNKMLSASDVFITNNRTQALEKMGLSYEQIKQKHPHIIFAQVLGYGEKGPLRDKPGFDFTAYYAKGGLTGTLYEKGTSPLNPVPGFGDNQVAMYLAGGILAALHKRNQTGIGDKVTVSLYHAAIFALNNAITASQYGFSYPVTRTEVVSPFLNTYRTRDDRWLQIAAPEYDRLFPVIMQAIGREDLIGNEQYCKLKNLAQYNTEVVKIIEDKIAERDADEWVEIFDNFDVPCEKASRWDEIISDRQAWENEYLHEINYATGNVRTLVDLPVKLDSLGKANHKRGPLIGENSIEILKSFGYSLEEIDQLLAEKVVLQGK